MSPANGFMSLYANEANEALVAKVRAVLNILGSPICQQFKIYFYIHACICVVLDKLKYIPEMCKFLGGKLVKRNMALLTDNGGSLSLSKQPRFPFVWQDAL